MTYFRLAVFVALAAVGALLLLDDEVLAAAQEVITTAHRPWSIETSQ